ncbi:MAG: FkbM family methyltransferase [Chloroflexi bacterium]|nr:MAG: FkbM family methyltransferase [Chloroflexota bacterium]TMB77193.1 MAG: FkbM family methyltransferase [Chloroflexota bacterium]TMC30661.1 MAG: FkbM family methyltransferase [Chloroflexota bacterium]TMC33341.1 MAG: FkbM family methyltransferase [Chloroflexota bacterium]TMC58779.1 MAG: FkbM family methyltransferase [Chloroflexota bacterium]
MKARRVLRLYGRYFPIDQGKDRVITFVHRVLRLGGEEISALPGGASIELDLDDYVQRSIFYRGVYEHGTVRRFRALLRPGQVVLDVGAHVGQYSMLAAAAVGPSGTVVAFEPEDDLRARLSANAERNGFTNVRALAIALSDRDGRSRFQPSPPGNRGMGRITTHGTREIIVARLDALFPTLGLDRLDILKLDVEGAELPALRGAEGTITRYRPALIVEASAANARAFGYGPAELESWLRERGYLVARVPRSANLVCVATRA